jgi:hypothetical protein
MTKNIQQAKSLLARLLALENLSVTHDSEAETASFDIINRKLVLPVLKDMQGFHYDAFVAHEVSHALNTPYDEEKQKKLDAEIPRDFLNITEDARIERLVQNKYPGTRKDFYQLYEDFSKPEKNMFGIEGKDLKTLSTIDRINLAFKIGKFVKVPFNQEEEKLLKMTDAAITFDDAAKAAKAVYEYMKETNQPVPPPGPNEQEGDGKGKKGKGQAGFTQREFEKNKNKNLVDGDAKKKNVKFGEALTSADIDRETIVNKKVFDKLKKAPQKCSEYQTFMNMVKPVINMMKNQFQVRKAASDYSKTAVSKTGKIDMKEISNFMTRDDIFQRNEVVFNEKNHGFVFFIDWSGSMGDTILATFKQLLVLMYFCRGIGIPFEVYGFTSGVSSIKKEKLPTDKIMASGIQNNTIFLLLESCMSKKDFESVCETIFTNIQGVHHMSDTPLNNTAMLSDIIVEKFKAKYGREKNIVVLLSDGGAGDVLGSGKQTTILHNPELSKNYEISSYHDVFKYVKDRQSITKMIGMYITDSLQSGVVDIIYPKRDTSKLDYKNHFANKRWAVFDKGVAFDKFFAIDVCHFAINDREDKLFKRLDKYAKKEDVIKGFENKMKAMSTNMIFLNIFVNEIC